MDTNDLTYQINAAIFEVNRKLGPGFLEKVHENALLVELKERGLRAQNQAPINVSLFPLPTSAKEKVCVSLWLILVFEGALACEYHGYLRLGLIAGLDGLKIP